jgi:hypothetical protein
MQPNNSWIPGQVASMLPTKVVASLGSKLWEMLEDVRVALPQVSLAG